MKLGYLFEDFSPLSNPNPNPSCAILPTIPCGACYVCGCTECNFNVFVTSISGVCFTSKVTLSMNMSVNRLIHSCAGGILKCRYPCPCS